jgi:hypothetical protein
MTDDTLPGTDDLPRRIGGLEQHCHILLYLSAVNLIINILTIGVAYLIATG